jgi:hypothetical protein
MTAKTPSSSPDDKSVTEGSERAEKDKPINISSADDVDIDEDNPDSEEGASSPPAK